MKSFLKMFKPWDIIIILATIVISLTPFFIFGYIQAEKITDNSMNVAVISVDNQEMQRVTLTDNKTNEFLDIPEIDCSLDTVEVNNDQIRIKESNCPEQICVRRGYISKPGETIICLPHKVIIEIQSINGPEEELIISS